MVEPSCHIEFTVDGSRATFKSARGEKRYTSIKRDAILASLVPVASWTHAPPAELLPKLSATNAVLWLFARKIA